MVRFRLLSSPFTSCIVEAPDSEGPIGQDALKRLDLLADCGTGTMAPRRTLVCWPCGASEKARVQRHLEQTAGASRRHVKVALDQTSFAAIRLEQVLERAAQGAYARTRKDARLKT